VQRHGHARLDPPRGLRRLLPWLDARVEPGPAFEAFRPLFDGQWAATQAEDWDRADELYQEIKSALRLRTQTAWT
jgi:hypothetical protein